MLNFMLSKLTVAQSEFVEHFLRFVLFNKKLFQLNFLFFILANVLFKVGMLRGCKSMFSKKCMENLL